MSENEELHGPLRHALSLDLAVAAAGVNPTRCPINLAPLWRLSA